MTALALIPDDELEELRTIAASAMVHSADVYLVTRTRGAAAKTVDTYDVPVATLPCRVRPFGIPAPLERVLAGAVASPDAYVVAFPAGTPVDVVPATAVLHATGTTRVRAVDGGTVEIPWELWLRVQGAPQVRGSEVSRKVLAVPTAPVGGAAAVAGVLADDDMSRVVDDFLRRVVAGAVS